MPGFATRTVRDSAAALDVVAGFHPGDPYAAPGETGFLAGLERAEGRPLRIAFVTGPFEGHPVDPVCAHAVRDTAAACKALGHHVEEA